MENISRYDRLRAHMALHRISWKEVADIIDIGTPAGAQMCLQRDRIENDRRVLLINSGFPEDLLPLTKEKSWNKKNQEV